MTVTNRSQVPDVHLHTQPQSRGEENAIENYAGERRLFALAIFLALLSLIFTGCRTTDSDAALRRYEFLEPHMGTLFKITLFASDSLIATRSAEAAFRRIEQLNRMMTDYDQRSELMQLSQRPVGEAVKISEDLFNALEHAQRIARLSDGAFDVTVGPQVQLWRKSRKERTLPSADELAKVSRAVGWQKLRLDYRARTATLTVPGMRLDLGGIGKGYAADRALSVLRGFGVTRAMVAASGDLAIGDPPPGKAGWSIAISSIDANRDRYTGIVILKNVGISTSGDTEQFVEIDGKRYSHIVNPKTGYGLTERIGATVIAPNATTSDGLAKVLSVLGAERGMEILEREPNVAALAVTIDSHGQKNLVQSKRFSKIPTRAQDSAPLKPELKN